MGYILMNEWIRLTSVGQIKKGYSVLLSHNGDAQLHKAEEILMPGTATEEILLSKKDNLYFIVSMAIDGTSWAKGVKYQKGEI
jgi:hypothetical protein